MDAGGWHLPAPGWVAQAVCVVAESLAGWLAGCWLARSLAESRWCMDALARSLAGTPSSQTCQGRPTHPRTPFTLCITPKRTLKMSFSAQPVVIDGKGHLLGRLASVVSKQVSWRRKSVDQEGYGELRWTGATLEVGQWRACGECRRWGGRQRCWRCCWAKFAEVLQHWRDWTDLQKCRSGHHADIVSSSPTVHARSTSTRSMLLYSRRSNRSSPARRSPSSDVRRSTSPARSSETS